MIEETNELSDTRYFEYDFAGNLTEKTDRNGLVTEYTYDNLYRLTQEVWLDGMTTVNTLDFTYDAANQLLTAEDDVSSYAYTYDVLGRITVIDIDNGGPEVQLVQMFNLVGSRTALATGFDDGGGFDDDFENVYTYDNLQRLTRVDQIGVFGGNTVAEKRVDFAYNAAGQFTDITRYKDTDGGSGNLVATTSFGYDDIGRLTDLTHMHDTTTIADYDWTFDAFSRVTQMSFTSLVGNDGVSDYTYDDTSQLTDADHDFQTDEEYTYDENGNRTLTGYTTGDNNLLSTDGTHNYSYDDEGNRVLKTNISTGDYTEYEWDHRNRLVKITQKNSSNVITHEVEYTYDVFNRRIAKEIDADGAGGGGVDTIQYIYDNDDIILAFDGAGALTNRYLHGPMVDQILADEDASNDVIWPLADNLGSIRDIVDSTGSVLNHLTYDAYGNITSETATSVDHIFAYTGRERDEESDLQFNRARYYDAQIGRWASEDPIGFSAEDTNLHRYVANSVLNFVDGSGLQVFDPADITGIGGIDTEHAYPPVPYRIDGIDGLPPLIQEAIAGNPSLLATSSNGYRGHGRFHITSLDDFKQFFAKIEQEDWPNSAFGQISRGCVGLAMARLGYFGAEKDEMTFPYQVPGAIIFDNLLDAKAYLRKVGKEAEENESGQEYNLIAFQLTGLTIDRTDGRTRQQGQLFVDELELDPEHRGTYNFATWFEMEDGIGYWEFMNHGIYDPLSGDYRPTTVWHSPFLPETYGPTSGRYTNLFVVAPVNSGG